MKTSQQSFWNNYQNKQFAKAQQVFDSLSDEEKQETLAKLFQQSEFFRTPHSVSVLFRELHDDKNFHDFHEAWFPPKESLNPRELYGKTYQQFFPAPIRVINAINFQNPKEIVSIGLHWLTEEEAKHMFEYANNPSNKQRGDSIAKVAEKTKAGVFEVASDDFLGTPF